MGNDLPDFQSQVIGVGLEATSFRSGLDADKPASPAAGDIWLARDTHKLYMCMVAGAWKGFDASELDQGILTLYADLVGGGYKLTGIGAPSAATDGARKSEVDTVNARLDDVSVAQPTRALDTPYKNQSGKIKFVSIIVKSDSVGGSPLTADAYCDSGSSPTTKVCETINNTIDPGSSVVTSTLTFIVPPSYYYQITASVPGHNPYIATATEWDLL